MNFERSIASISGGGYTARLAENEEEVLKAQRLRYKSLRLKYNSKANADDGIDKDGYDEYCSHIVVLLEEEIVATYRLIGEEHLFALGVFLSETEFDLKKLKANKEGKILELGRAVVSEEHRNGIVLKLLWDGIVAYIKKYGYRYIIGTASFEGLDHTPYVNGYSYLINKYRMPEELIACSRPEDTVKFVPVPIEELDGKTALKEIPSLIKGYIHMGARFGEGFFKDKSFNCLDMFLFLDVSKSQSSMFKDK